MPQHTLRFATLASGSSGNALYCETAQGAVLIDAGVSGAAVARGLAAIRADVGRIQGLILTHGHSDHMRGAGLLSRRHGFPLFMTAATRRAIGRGLGRTHGVRLFAPGDALRLAGLHIQTVPTPHDSDDSVALVLQRGRTRLGVLTDLGHAFDGLGALVAGLDAVVLESNYDPHMLRHGPYPAHVKARIRGPVGHLSNDDAAALIRDHATDRLRAILLGHLSQNNNHPHVALDCHRRTASKFLETHEPILDVAPRHTASRLFVVRASDGAPRAAPTAAAD